VRGGYDPERAAMVLADAMALGDKGAAKKWDLSIRTIANYRARLKNEPELARLFAERKRERHRDLATMRVAFLRRAIRVMTKKLDAATLHEVAGAVKIVGELHQVSEALGDDGSAGEDPEAAEDAGGGLGAPQLAAH
jgi:hypothetical protein